MSTKASTAALRRMSERLSLAQRRAPRHPASGAKAQRNSTPGARAAVLAPGNLKRWVNRSLSARASVIA
jgi:hypothetical protein